MRYTILIATLSSVVASVVTTAVIGGSFFGAGTASSADSPIAAMGIVSPGGVEELIQGDVDCQKDVTPVDSLKVLRHDAGLSVQQDEPCPDIGTVIPAGEGVPGPQGPQGDEGPEGPQGEQGPPGTSLFAHVNLMGILEAGTAVSASRNSKGVYTVTFGQSVAECAPVVTVGALGGGQILNAGHVGTNVSSGIPQDVKVYIQGSDNLQADTDFNLIVVC